MDSVPLAYGGINNPPIATSSKFEKIERDYKSFLSSPAQLSTTFNTLDEPISETIVKLPNYVVYI